METMELLEQARAGNKEARNQIVEENTRLVWSIVKRFTGRGYDPEDIFQIGCIGLIKAIDRFDTSFEVKFSSYAVPMISGEIKRFLRDDGMIKVSRSLKEKGWIVKKAAEQLSYELGRSATIDEIAAATELETEEIVIAMEANSEVDSIERLLYQGEEKETEMAEKVTNHILLMQLLSELDTMERQLIEYRYFRDMTQSQTAKLLGTSQVQISRMEKKILAGMRDKAKI